ncbi:hypothetical protein [Spiroplasma poulsonii]|uniref:hypothetical protein n=1 Tax=Spiroplasma poulsonii TaxID=2138 RepID=UPI001F4C6C15|nr:hypothetical protein [Spiroplasma poulsonii]UNF61994.1 hypothetical protein MNU24_00575 [Spiroplasma poulsonii]
MIILMIKLLLLMLWNSNPTPKRQKQSYSGKRKTHDQNTSNYQTKPKIIATSFSLGKNMNYALFKRIKIQF